MLSGMPVESTAAPLESGEKTGARCLSRLEACLFTRCSRRRLTPWSGCAYGAAR